VDLLFPYGGRVLELRRCRDFRFPHQPADRQLLRDRHAADNQPRPCSDDGVFGMLGIGLVVFAIRQTVDEALWRDLEKYVRVGFWGLNGCLLMMVVMSLFPAGVLQLVDVLESSSLSMCWRTAIGTREASPTPEVISRGCWSGAASQATWYSASSVSCPSRLLRCAPISGAGKLSWPPAFRSSRERYSPWLVHLAPFFLT
jgi:hypothetical protein